MRTYKSLSKAARVTWLNSAASAMGCALFADTWQHAIGLWLILEAILMTIEVAGCDNP